MDTTPPVIEREPYSQVRVLNRQETIKLLSVDARTFDRMEAAGDAPPKTQLSKRRIGYRLTDIDTWLNARRRAS
jgi:predicted DNA-binding transcriptional regulator AlpA